jgi:hypothetical protein
MGTLIDDFKILLLHEQKALTDSMENSEGSESRDAAVRQCIIGWLRKGVGDTVAESIAMNKFVWRDGVHVYVLAARRGELNAKHAAENVGIGAAEWGAQAIG